MPDTSVKTAREVAGAGYQGMMAGRVLVVPGLSNKIGVQLLRLSPRAVVRQVVRSIQEKRS